jgi:predicted O-methyltransferase YrrM
MSGLRRFARSTLAGRILLIPYRFRNALLTVAPPVFKALKWSFVSREHYNYSYDLTPLNRRYLAAFVSAITGKSIPEITRYLDEIDSDQSLRSHISALQVSAEERYVADPIPRFGRRVGWYALIRAAKPRVVVETGVDKGLGSCVIAAALKRNTAEGSPGKLIGIDLNPSAGYLFQPPYSDFGQIMRGDSIAALRALSGPVDLFIHDSDHSAAHETAEFEAVSEKLAHGAYVLSDNADQTDVLLQFAARSGRKFLYFADKPLDHWWPGDGIGVAYH